MKKVFLVLALLGLVGCSEETIQLNDHKEQIDRNTAEIELLKAQDALHDLRIDSLETRVSDLESRMSLAEANIDANTADIIDLFDLVDGLDNDLNSLRSQFYYAYWQLRQSDRQLRREMRRKVRRLRRQLYREIYQRRLADNNLQNQIDQVESDLQSFEAQQQVINGFLTGAIFLTNIRISQLDNQVTNALNNLDSRLDSVENEIISINNEISSMQSQLSSITAQLNDVESRLVSVVYPCGESNSEEVLLQTQDGIVAYFQEMRNKTISFSDSITVDSYDIPAHTDKFCKDTNFINGECNDYGYRHVGSHTIPAQTYNVGDSATVKVLKKAYLDVLGDGNYRTTDGYSCNFSIVNGEVQ